MFYTRVGSSPTHGNRESVLFAIFDHGIVKKVSIIYYKASILYDSQLILIPRFLGIFPFSHRVITDFVPYLIEL